MSFRKAGECRIGGKFLIYGRASSGKSYFGLTFPKIVAIDSETGLAHYETRNIKLNNGNTYRNLLMVDDTSDLATFEEDLDEFVNIAEEKGARTLLIDSETKIYNALQVAANEVEEKRARRKGQSVEDSTLSQRSWGRIRLISLRLQQVKIDLAAKGYNVVSIAQEAEIKDEDGKKIGVKSDTYKNIDYDYDTVLRFFTKFDAEKKLHFYAEVRKDRTEVTKVGDIIEDPCFDIWADYYKQRDNGERIETSYAADIESTTQHLADEAFKIDDLVESFKKMMSVFNTNKNTVALGKVAQYLRDNAIDIKNLALCEVDALKKLVDFTEKC